MLSPDNSFIIVIGQSLIKVKKKFDAFAKSFPQLGFYVKTKSCEILLLHFKNGKKFKLNSNKMFK